MNETSNQLSIDPILAKQLFVDGAVLIITGVPKGTEFGIDLCSYIVDKNFRGVKMIAPGLHYVWCAARNSEGFSAPRVGFAHFFKRKEILVREWDDNVEELRERQIPNADEEKQRIREHLKELDRFLAPYDVRFLKKWSKFTYSIEEATLNRCKPESDTIRTNIQLASCSDAERPRGSLEKSHSIMKHKFVKNEDDLLPKLKPINGTAPRFHVVPERIPANCSPAEVTQHSMDCIVACNSLLHSFENPIDLIQEIQLAFVFFLVGHSIESLTFWRKVLELLSHSEEAVQLHHELYCEYCKILGVHLPHLPEELMQPSQFNTVYTDIRKILTNMKLCGLSDYCDNLIRRLGKLMNWQFNDLLQIDPEELPVVVENFSTD